MEEIGGKIENKVIYKLESVEADGLFGDVVAEECFQITHFLRRAGVLQSSVNVHFDIWIEHFDHLLRHLSDLKWNQEIAGTVSEEDGCRVVDGVGSWEFSSLQKERAESNNCSQLLWIRQSSVNRQCSAHRESTDSDFRSRSSGGDFSTNELMNVLRRGLNSSIVFTRSRVETNEIIPCWHTHSHIQSDGTFGTMRTNRFDIIMSRLTSESIRPSVSLITESVKEDECSFVLPTGVDNRRISLRNSGHFIGIFFVRRRSSK